MGDQGLLWGEGIHGGGNLIAYHIPPPIDSSNEHSWQEAEMAAFDQRPSIAIIWQRVTHTNAKH